MAIKALPQHSASEHSASEHSASEHSASEHSASEHSAAERYVRGPDEQIDRRGVIPFAIMHLLALGAFFFPVGVVEWAVCFALYFVRMFGITAGYHRYFAHRAYKVGRVTQFALAWIGCMSAQKGPLWWASHHRHHHKYSDMPEDIHSPKRGFWWSHVGWIVCKKYEPLQADRIKDFTCYPELMWMERFWWVPPTTLAVGLFLIGGWSLLFVGFFFSTLLTYHGTFTINSLAHVFGSRRFETTDTSRNNLLLALITLGEGWHNNHHHYQSSANQGFYWWEIDVSYYVLKAMGWVGLAWDLRKPTEAALARGRIDHQATEPRATRRPAVARPLTQG